MGFEGEFNKKEQQKEMQLTPEQKKYIGFSRAVFNYCTETIEQDNEGKHYYTVFKTHTESPHDIISNFSPQKGKEIKKILSEEEIKSASKLLDAKLAGNQHVSKSDNSILDKMNRGKKLESMQDICRGFVATRLHFKGNWGNIEKVLNLFWADENNQDYKPNLLLKEVEISSKKASGYSDFRVIVSPSESAFEGFWAEYSAKSLENQPPDNKKSVADINMSYYVEDQSVLAENKQKALENFTKLEFEIQILPEEMVYLKTLEEPYYYIRRAIERLLLQLIKNKNPHTHITSKDISGILDPNNSGGLYNFIVARTGNKNNQNETFLIEKLVASLSDEKARQICGRILRGFKPKKSESSKFLQDLKKLCTVYNYTQKISNTIFNDAPSILPFDNEAEVQNILSKMYQKFGIYTNKTGEIKTTSSCVFSSSLTQKYPPKIMAKNIIIPFKRTKAGAFAA